MVNSLTNGPNGGEPVIAKKPARNKAPDHGTLWITVPGAGVPGKLLQVVRGTRQLLGLLPLGDGLVSVYWGLRNDTVDAVKARGLDALKGEMLA